VGTGSLLQVELYGGGSDPPYRSERAGFAMVLAQQRPVFESTADGLRVHAEQGSDLVDAAVSPEPVLAQD